VVLLSREYGRAFHRQHRLVQESLAGMNAALQENVSGIRLVKAFALEAREEERFGRQCREYYRHNLAVARTSAAFHGAIGFLAGAGVALVLYLGGRAVALGELTLGDSLPSTPTLRCSPSPRWRWVGDQPVPARQRGDGTDQRVPPPAHGVRGERSRGARRPAAPAGRRNG